MVRVILCLPLLVDSVECDRYRAKVKKASALKKEALLYFIDYGNEETLSFSRIRPLDKEARLR
jgi:hypothetical protein